MSAQAHTVSSADFYTEVWFYLEIFDGDEWNREGSETYDSFASARREVTKRQMDDWPGDEVWPRRIIRVTNTQEVAG